MATTLERLNANPIPWLLEPDPINPGVRLLTLTKILHRPADDPEVKEARQMVSTSGPVPIILDAQDKEGYWAEPGPGYLPKYKSTVWSITFLAQLGADGNLPGVQAGCDYVLENCCAPPPYGGFSMSGTASGLIHCLQGNLAAALLDLGWLGDERLDPALDWLARSITGENIPSSDQKNAPGRYYRSGNSGPNFHCSANDHKQCAWGAVKCMLALSKVPETARTPSIRAAIEKGIEFLLGNDPAEADYPMGYNTKPNRSWFQFGYPIGYITDVLQNMEALTALGCGDDPRLANATDLLLSKQDEQGRWIMEYTYNGKTWVDVEEKKQPSKWVTWRALQVLKRIN
ncbi:MAG: hypothetical protein JXA42_06455 [Anaerolineales bacterium]|nr:hypothetical protein [Anaerolineales bacterium]